MRGTEESPSASQYARATGLAQIFQAAGDMIVYQGGEPYRWSHWRPPAAPITASTARTQPSELLRAANGSVDFVGRQNLLADLYDWREAPGQDGVAVTLIHGPGGQGKTRLAHQLASLWQDDEWVVLNAHHSRDRSAPKAFAVPDLDRAAGVLVVVDYAERWDSANLLTLLGDTLIQGRLPVRVLLLARPAGTWWQSLSGRIQRDLRITPSQRELAALEREPGITREGLFYAARDRFAELLQIPRAQQLVPPAALPHHEAYQLVLTVQMAALAGVLAIGHHDRPPADPMQVSQYLLARERDHWQAMNAAGRETPLATSPDAMGQLVYTATLTGRLGYTDGNAAVERARIESLLHPGQLLKDHAACYPPSRDPEAHPVPSTAADSETTVLEPLYPDLLGEDFLALSAPGHSYAFPADPWAAGAPARLLRTAEAEADGSAQVPAWIRHGLITLIETARRWPHLAERQLYPLLTDQPQLAMLAGGAALVALAQLSTISPTLLERIEAQLPDERHIDLDMGLAAVSARLSEHRVAATTDPASRAVIYGRLALRLFNAGLYDQALLVSNRAVLLNFEVFDTDDHVLPNLATTLSIQSAVLAALGRFADAVRAIETVVTVYRELVAFDRDAFLPSLAGSLTLYVGRLVEAGQVLEGLPFGQEAVDLYRELLGSGQKVPVSDLANMAMTVESYAGALAHAGQLSDALRSMEGALFAFHKLVSYSRSTYLPDLARATTSQASLLLNTGKLAAALSASQEAIDLHRELIAANPDPHLPGYFRSLTISGQVLAYAGHCREAVAPLVEALDGFALLPPTIQELAGMAVDALRHAYAGDAAGVAEEFHALTGRELPDQITEAADQGRASIPEENERLRGEN